MCGFSNQEICPPFLLHMRHSNCANYPPSRSVSVCCIVFHPPLDVPVYACVTIVGGTSNQHPQFHSPSTPVEHLTPDIFMGAFVTLAPTQPVRECWREKVLRRLMTHDVDS